MVVSATVEQARCCGCKAIVPLTAEQIRVSGVKGWWHPECHETATADVNRVLALRAVAKMHGYKGA